MDITTLLGLFISFAAVLGGAVLEGLGPEALVQPTAFMIVILGTVGAVVMNHTADELKNCVTNFIGIFMAPKEKPKDTLLMLVDFAQKARKEGLLALQGDISQIDDPFLKKGLEMMTDGTDPDLLRDLLETELHMFEEDITRSAKVLEDFGALAPCVGIIGAVLGLIHVMSNLSDPAKLGGGIAVAFVATVYGVGAANLICLPGSGKMKFRGKDSVLCRTMIIEGIMSIQAGESPNFIREKLKIYLPPAVAATITDDK